MPGPLPISKKQSPKRGAKGFLCFRAREPQRLLQPQGDPQKALEYANKALKSIPSPTAHGFRRERPTKGRGNWTRRSIL